MGSKMGSLFAKLSSTGAWLTTSNCQSVEDFAKESVTVTSGGNLFRCFVCNSESVSKSCFLLGEPVNYLSIAFSVQKIVKHRLHVCRQHYRSNSLKSETQESADCRTDSVRRACLSTNQRAGFWSREANGRRGLCRSRVPGRPQLQVRPLQSYLELVRAHTAAAPACFYISNIFTFYMKYF